MRPMVVLIGRFCTLVPQRRLRTEADFRGLLLEGSGGFRGQCWGARRASKRSDTVHCVSSVDVRSGLLLRLVQLSWG